MDWNNTVLQCFQLFKRYCVFFCAQHTRNSNVVLDETDVVLCLDWEVVPFPCCRRVCLPTGEGLILNLHFLQNVHVGWNWTIHGLHILIRSSLKPTCWKKFSWITWEMGNSFPIEFVGNSDFNFIQHIQNVKFCQSNAAKQVSCHWTAAGHASLWLPCHVQ